MTTHARGPGDSVSAAKLTLYGSIGTALIGAVSAIIVQVVVNHDNVSTVSKGSPPTTITPTASQVSDRSSANQFVISATGEVTVSGSAQEDVNGMFVLIGPKPSGGYWAGYANVVNQQWQADVATDPPWQNYTIQAYPYHVPSGGAAQAPGAPPVPKATSEPAVAPAGRLVSETTGQSALKFTFQGTDPTTTPPPPPDQIVDCAVQFGPSCFNGPGFGPPSVYK
jgi:hypothetical protein